MGLEVEAERTVELFKILFQIRPLIGHLSI